MTPGVCVYVIGRDSWREPVPCGRPLPCLYHPTADDLRDDFSRLNARGESLDPSGVNFDKLAEAINTDHDVKGWEAPRVLPPEWVEDPRSVRGLDGTARYINRSRRLTVILSCTMELDGRAWFHLSVSHNERIPTWGEFGIAKQAFLGDREAYQVIPPKERYVNINKRVLHLFALYDQTQTALPDFTRGTGSL